MEEELFLSNFISRRKQNGKKKSETNISLSDECCYHVLDVTYEQYCGKSS